MPSVNQPVPPVGKSTKPDWKEQYLDWFFELSHRGARRRQAFRFWLFFLLWFGLVLYNWSGTIRRTSANSSMCC